MTRLAGTLSGQCQACTQIMMIELLAIAKKVKNNKTPGVDGIPNRALKEAIILKPYLFAKIYNACIKEEIFPDPWKV